MECRYCQAANADDEHRCRRCGRRLRVSPVYTGSSAAAPVLQVVEEHAARASAVAEPHSSPEPSAPRRSVTYQRTLFTSRELPMVVQFDTIAPGLVQPLPHKPHVSAPRPRRRKIIAGQQALPFSSRSARPNTAIYGDARVAIHAHRAMAAALDASIMLMAMALFAIVYKLAGGAFILGAKTAPMFLGAAAGIVIFYRLLWCLANGDTIGQRWTRLRLVNFDGLPPTRAQRLYRTASGFLSVAAGGIGLLWGLVDEETLTWHDHISKTFPTPVH
jgi:uncharacterized RDD family membrane protein YckC